MLTHISIKNYALIRALELDLKGGLTTITGETGSGKSIIIGALGLVLGDRADIKTLGLPTEKCVIEATFSISKEEKTFFENNNLDFSEETYFRREITPSGKSRAFINDTPVTLSVLKGLGGRLVDIHSQHQNSILHQQEFQFTILDSFAKTTNYLEKYQNEFAQYQELSIELKALEEAALQAKMDHDYHVFQLDEMVGIEFENLDIDSLEQEMQTLNNAEEIKSILVTVSEGIEWSDRALISSLENLVTEISKISDINSDINDIKTRLDSVVIELKDIRSESESIGDGVSMDHERAAKVTELLDKIYRLQQKHHVDTLEDLIRKKNELEDKVHAGIQFEGKIEAVSKKLKGIIQSLDEKSKAINAKRKLAVPKLQKGIEKVFVELGLDKAKIKVVLDKTETYNKYGKEKISLEFSANPGSPLQPIEKVASGGEISRVMLALKAIFSKHTKMPTLILDEIDNGVSGEIGKRLGVVMKDISKEMQLLTITHLPQIAGKGTHHLKVYKKEENGRTATYIKELNDEQRVDELAEMLGGKQMTAAAKENAKELMG